VPIYTLTIGGSESTAGLFMTIVSLTALFVRPVMGYFIDSHTRRKVLLIGTVTLTVTGFAFGFAFSIYFVFILAAGIGVAISALTTAGPTIVADITPSVRLAEGLSIYGIAMNLATSVGPFAAMILISRISYHLTFTVASVVAAVGLAAAFRISYEKQRIQDVIRIHPGNNKMRIRSLFEKSAAKPAVNQLLLAFGASMTYSFIPLYGRSRGVDISLFFIFFAVSTMLVSLYTGRIIQKMGARRVFPPAMLLIIGGFVLLAFAQSLPIMLAAAILYGIGSGLGFASNSIICMQQAAVHRRGAANATLFAAMDIGVALGSAILGAIIAKFGFSTAFIIASIVIGMNLGLFLIMNGRQQLAGDEQEGGSCEILDSFGS
jgi:MFS family permease